MAEHDDLEVLGTAGADGEPGQAGDEAAQNARHSWSASAAFPLISTHDRIFGPHTLETADESRRFHRRRAVSGYIASLLTGFAGRV